MVFDKTSISKEKGLMLIKKATFVAGMHNIQPAGEIRPAKAFILPKS